MIVPWWWKICHEPGAVRRHSEVRCARRPWWLEVYFSITRPSASSQPRMFSTMIGAPSGSVAAATSAAVPAKPSSPPEAPNS